MVAALALLLLASTVFATTELRGASASTFAPGEALAALNPAAGEIVHARIRSWARTSGASKPVLAATEYNDVWVDFEHQRERCETHNSASGETVCVSVTADGRTRYLADAFDTPQVDHTLGENYASGSAGSSSLWPYFYLKAFLPRGQAVGKVVRDGKTYWDVRWENVEDENGQPLNGRALLHQGDYGPALIERQYPGGARECWEVLDWESLPACELPAGLLDPSSLGTPETPIASAWSANALKRTINHPCYWAGPRIERVQIVSQLGDITTSRNDSPLFVLRKGFTTDIASVLGDTYAEAWYTGPNNQQLMIASAARQPALAEKIQSLTPEAELTSKPSVVGKATIARLKSGEYLAGINTPSASIAILTKDMRLLEATLESLREVE